jgi:hypothetical protein
MREGYSCWITRRWLCLRTGSFVCTKNVRFASHCHARQAPLTPVLTLRDSHAPTWKSKPISLLTVWSAPARPAPREAEEGAEAEEEGSVTCPSRTESRRPNLLYRPPSALVVRRSGGRGLRPVEKERRRLSARPPALGRSRRAWRGGGGRVARGRGVDASDLLDRRGELGGYRTGLFLCSAFRRAEIWVAVWFISAAKSTYTTACRLCHTSRWHCWTTFGSMQIASSAHVFGFADWIKGLRLAASWPAGLPYKIDFEEYAHFFFWFWGNYSRVRQYMHTSTWFIFVRGESTQGIPWV